MWGALTARQWVWADSMTSTTGIRAGSGTRDGGSICGFRASLVECNVRGAAPDINQSAVLMSWKDGCGNHARAGSARGGTGPRGPTGHPWQRQRRRPDLDREGGRRQGHLPMHCPRPRWLVDNTDG